MHHNFVQRSWNNLAQRSVQGRFQELFQGHGEVHAEVDQRAAAAELE